MKQRTTTHLRDSQRFKGCLYWILIGIVAYFIFMRDKPRTKDPTQITTTVKP